MKSIIISLLFIASSTYTLANTTEMIVVDHPGGQANAQVLSIGDLMRAPTYQAHEEEIILTAKLKLAQSLALDPTLKTAISESLDELPFQRTVDLEFAFFSGIPDLIAICLEGHPVRRVAIEACASTFIFSATVSANIKYRWDLVVKRTSSGRIHQLAAGPGFGVHLFWSTFCFDVCSGGMHSISTDIMGSLEYVFWIARHFGLTVQLDLGASYLNYLQNDMNSHVIPTGKLTLGVAF